MKKRIVYMGTPDYARVILQTLVDDVNIEIPLVLTQPDRPVGRKKELKAPEVKTLALEYGLKVLQPLKLSDEGIYEAIVDAKPDYIIVAAFGQMLPRKILDIAPCINLHASLLPYYRGASPVQQVLLNGDQFSGVTAMLMEEGLDSGPILAYRYFEIPMTMTLPALMDQLSQDAAALTRTVVYQFEALKPITQIRAEATHCKKIKKLDGEIDFGNAATIYNQYRGFFGWPGIFTVKGVKLSNIELIETQSTNKRSEILAIEDDGVILGCQQGSLKIGELQAPSKKAMDAKSYCVSRGLKIGNTLL